MDGERVRQIHPTAIVSARAEIGHGVSIGPYCIVGDGVLVEDGATLHSHVVLDGDTRIGPGATLHPFCTVGLMPQDLKYRGERTRCEVGARTTVREHCTINRGTVTGSGVTRVGADCLLMAVTHVAHDCEIGDGVVIANNVVMGGHVTIGERAVIGGSAALQQFVRIGRGAMVGGVSGVERDVVPFGAVLGNRARLVGLNFVGLKRRGLDRAQLHRLLACFRALFPVGDADAGNFAARVEAATASYGDDPLAAEMLAFIAAPSRRGLIRAGRRAEEDG